MSNDSTRKEGDDLQFDRVAGAEGGLPSGQAGVTCAVCKKAFLTEYYAVNGVPVCEQCKEVAVTSAAAGLKARRFPKAILLGVLAAIGGAIVYYGVIALANLEIGIVAILCGYMVGWGVRRGSGGFGGRRYQVLAAALTYFSVALAYTPLALKGAMTGNAKASTSADSGRSVDSAAVADSMRAAAVADSLTTDSLLAGITDTSPVGTRPVVAAPSADSAGKAEKMSVPFALGALLLLIWGLPLIAVFGSMPSGLISGLIIAIGMRQAWHMNAPVQFDVVGPLRVGDKIAPATS